MAEKREALLIANNHYEDEELRQLVAPAQDAEGLANVLADPEIGGFKAETSLNEPSYHIRLSIEEFFADRKRQDLLLLYISGHGIKDIDGKLYFATTDTRRKRLRATAVSANFVNDVMHSSRSRRQVLLLDCCYSGAFARGMSVRADRRISTGEYFEEGRGHVVLTASDAMQYAFEGEDVKGQGISSVFTQTLIDGLATGQADLDKDGRVSVDELYDYIYERITERMPQQKPRKWAFDLQGEIVIANNPNPLLKAVELPPERQNSIEVNRNAAYARSSGLRRWWRVGAVLLAIAALFVGIGVFPGIYGTDEDMPYLLGSLLSGFLLSSIGIEHLGNQRRLRGRFFVLLGLIWITLAVITVPGLASFVDVYFFIQLAAMFLSIIALGWSFADAIRNKAV